MSTPRRIFVVSDFKDEYPRSIRMQPRMWVKGLLRLGHDVQRFSYRNIMLQQSPFPSKRIARSFAKKKADSLLADQIKRYHPDVVFFLGLKYIDAATVDVARQAAGRAVIVARDEDPYPQANPGRIETASKADILVSTSAGRFLRAYKDAGISLCAFIPNMCDPDIQRRWPVADTWRTDIIFTGKVEHTRLERNSERYQLVTKLATMPNARIYGAFGVPRVEGMEYFYAISGAKIGLSINIANDVELYHSDRFINYIACGTLTLAKRVPQTERLFEDNVHLRYFDTVDEFFDMVRWYLEHNEQRGKLAAAGMERAHRCFNCQQIAAQLIDLIDKGRYDAPWFEAL